MERKNFYRSFIGFLLLCFMVSLSGDHLMAQTPAKGKYDALKRKYVKGEYPAPRFPSYLKKPKSADEVMPFARAAVRQTGGRTPLGLVNPGMTMLVITDFEDDEIILEAIRRAAEERGVKVQYLPEYEAAGVDRKDASDLYKITSRGKKSHDGLYEADVWFGKWQPKEVITDWLKARRPDLYDALYKDYVIPEDLKKVEERLERGKVAAGMIKYLDNHPEVNAIFWGTGGRPSHQRMLKHHSNKYFGNFIMGRRENMMSRVPSYPGDLWRLAEERTIEPLSWTEEAKVFDPEGTDFAFNVTQEDAEKWSRGVYNQGHLFMMPHQASGRYPYAVVDYPAIQKTYLTPIITKANGTFAGVSNHSGMFPRVEVEIKDGYIKEMRGEGPYVEIWREVHKNYPKIHELTYPWYPKDGAGYFWIYEAGLGTNPKFFNYWGEPTGERNHAGVIHWGFGTRAMHPPEGPTFPQKWFDWCKENKMPTDHWMHIHVKFITYQVRIRGTDKWLKLINKGRLTALDDPMVRALASRYGDPDDLLADEWVDEIPGINVPGSYAQYAKKPREYFRQIVDKIENGTYPYFYTPPSMGKKK